MLNNIFRTCGFSVFLITNNDIFSKDALSEFLQSNANSVTRAIHKQFINKTFTSFLQLLNRICSVAIRNILLGHPFITCILCPRIELTPKNSILEHMQEIQVFIIFLRKKSRSIILPMT